LVRFSQKRTIEEVNNLRIGDKNSLYEKELSESQNERYLYFYCNINFWSCDTSKIILYTDLKTHNKLEKQYHLVDTDKHVKRLFIFISIRNVIFFFLEKNLIGINCLFIYLYFSIDQRIKAKGKVFCHDNFVSTNPG